MRTGSGRAVAGRVLVGAAVVTVVVAPLLALIVRAVADEWRSPALLPQRFGWRAVHALGTDRLLGPAILNSTVVALCTVAIALIVAWPAARALAGDDRRWVLGTLLVPILMPPLAVGEGLAPWLLRLGLGDRLGGMVIAHLLYVIPYCVLALMPAFTDSLSQREQVATTLGAGTARRLASVTLPASRPHLWLAAGIGFTVSWSQYGTSLAVGGGIPMLPLVAVPFARVDPALAAALDLVMIVPPLALLAVATRSRARA
jgi:putative spermidine/putrescine transport system permease protein